MACFPDCDFLKPHSNEFSMVDCLSCVGPYYADQISNVCGGRIIGQCVQFFSQKPFDEVKRDLIRCAKNKRAGEKLATGQDVPLFNKRVMMSLLQMLAIGRKHTEYFKHYPVNILVSSSILNDYLTEVQK